MKTLETFLAHFDAQSLRDEFAAKWDEAMAANPPDAYAAAFLTPEKVEEHWRMSPLREDSLSPLLEMAERVRDDEWLLALAAYMHWRIFQDRDPNGQWSWPAPRPLEGDEAGCFHFLVALGFPPEYTAAQRALALGIPEDVIRDSCRQIGCYAFNFHRATGKAGIFPNQLSWLHVYFPPGRYYRLGRLEYQASVYSQPFKVYRRKTDGRTCALGLPGHWYTQEGEACLSGCDRPAAAWESSLEERDNGVFGHPVGHDARVSNEKVFLPADEWECALAPGDNVLNMHIPSGGGMAPELVRESIRSAIPFFDRHYPDKPAKAIVCTSWIFSNQLSECLPPDSNILSLQRMVHLVPISSSPSAGLWFVFLVQQPFDVAKLPRDTSMRRAIADWLAAGNVFHLGGMFLLRDEVPSS
jgi:hypothetical protein